MLPSALLATGLLLYALSRGWIAGHISRRLGLDSGRVGTGTTCAYAFFAAAFACLAKLGVIDLGVKQVALPIVAALVAVGELAVAWRKATKLAHDVDYVLIRALAEGRRQNAKTVHDVESALSDMRFLKLPSADAHTAKKMIPARVDILLRVGVLPTRMDTLAKSIRNERARALRGH